LSPPLKISIVIESLNYERGNHALLASVLQSLSQQTVPREAIEVILVADPQEHPELEALLPELDPLARLVHAPGAHYYAQKNRGAEVAETPVIGFIDSDCIPVNTWVETVLKHLTANSATPAAVQGTVVTDRSIQGVAFAVTSFGQVQGFETRETHMLTGNNCAFRRKEFLTAPFDEGPWFHGPEVSKVASIYAQGGVVLLDPGAEVYHAFYPGIANFLAFSAYWGWCFLHLRRGTPEEVRYAKLFDRLGWLAPAALVPAKMLMDTYRMWQQRKPMRLSWRQLVGATLFLLLMAPAAGYGALLERLGREPVTPKY